MKQRRRITISVGIGLVIFAFLAALAWYSRFSSVTVTTANLVNDAPVQVYGLGTIEAQTTSKVGFKISGILAEINADIGDTISKGAVLARLDDREQRAQFARSEAGVTQAQANLQRAKASVDRAQANYVNAKNINERRQSLLKTNNTSLESAQTAQAAQDATFGDLNLARSDVLVAEANITDAKAQRQLQSATLDFHVLLAPYNGLVTGRTKDLGGTVSPGESIFTIIDPKSVWVLAYIDESKAGEFRLGDSADIVLRSQPRVHYPGRVARIQPESDRVNEERRIEVAFDQIPENYGIGEQAEVFVTTAVLPHALLVPEAALLDVGGGRAKAWTVEHGTIQQRDVALGHRLLDGRFEIVDGIPTGVSVISEVNPGLRVGRMAQMREGASR